MKESAGKRLRVLMLVENPFPTDVRVKSEGFTLAAAGYSVTERQASRERRRRVRLQSLGAYDFQEDPGAGDPGAGDPGAGFALEGAAWSSSRHGSVILLSTLVLPLRASCIVSGAAESPGTGVGLDSSVCRR